MPSKKNQQNYWSFYPSEPFTFRHFNVRHPVIEMLFFFDLSNFKNWTIRNYLKFNWFLWSGIKNETKNRCFRYVFCVSKMMCCSRISFCAFSGVLHWICNTHGWILFTYFHCLFLPKFCLFQAFLSCFRHPNCALSFLVLPTFFQPLEFT